MKKGIEAKVTLTQDLTGFEQGLANKLCQEKQVVSPESDPRVNLSGLSVRLLPQCEFSLNFSLVPVQLASRRRRLAERSL